VRERHRDLEPAAGARVEPQLGAVGVGDGAHDREPEPGARPVGVPAEALERLGQPAHVVG
jgi:hypothetical protein